MKISKSSWHYRLLAKVKIIDDWSFKRWSLCSYFWAVVLAVCIFFIAFPMALLVYAGLMIAPILALLGVDIPLEVFHFGIIAEVVTAVIVALVLRERYVRNKDYEAPKEPGLVKSWVVARKSKVCPLIDFEG